MSLLLEALKKAEKAKEEAQRRATEGGGAEPEASVFDTDATIATDGRHITRRDELPDISAPLEILSDDLRPSTQAKPAVPLELISADEPPAQRSEAPRRPAARAPSAAQAADASSNERAAAQKVFEAKFREPNPRMPFFLTMGLLGAFAAGTAIYFYIQLRPPTSLVNTNPARSPNEKPVQIATEKRPAPATGAPAGAAGQEAIPGLPGGSTPATIVAAAPASPAAPAAGGSKPAPAAPLSAAPAVPTSVPSAVPTPAPAAPSARPAARSAGATRSLPADPDQSRPLSVTRSGMQIHPQVSAGYAAYQAGDLAKARTDYQQVLREEPANRDALLGLAAVEMRAQRYDLAQGYYQRILQADPRDAYAQAGLLALRSEQLDPVLVESRVKSLLAADREANVLYFTLGNQYAQQGRWAEAQQAYFKAFAADPENADYAFNVAVSLDQLRQPKLALEYYRRALALAEKRSASFVPDAARSRVQQLSR